MGGVTKCYKDGLVESANMDSIFNFIFLTGFIGLMGFLSPAARCL